MSTALMLIQCILKAAISIHDHDSKSSNSGIESEKLNSLHRAHSNMNCARKLGS